MEQRGVSIFPYIRTCNDGLRKMPQYIFLYWGIPSNIGDGYRILDENTFQIAAPIPGAQMFTLQWMLEIREWMGIIPKVRHFFLAPRSNFAMDAGEWVFNGANFKCLAPISVACRPFFPYLVSCNAQTKKADKGAEFLRYHLRHSSFDPH